MKYAKFIFLVLVLFGLFSQKPPVDINLKESFCTYSLAHPMGCDRVGRDVFGLFAYGSLLTILIAIPTKVIALLVSLVFCLISYVFKGIVAELINSLSAVFLSIPSLLIALVVIFTSEKGLLVFILSITLSEWANSYEILYTKIREVKDSGYATISKIFGAGEVYVFRNHILPEIYPLLLVLFLTGIPAVIMTLSIFSYLGIDFGSEYFGPGLGEQISFSKDYFHRSPLSVLAPILGIFLVVNLFYTGEKKTKGIPG